MEFNFPSPHLTNEEKKLYVEELLLQNTYDTDELRAPVISYLHDLEQLISQEANQDNSDSL
jgi:hypothetical protein